MATMREIQAKIFDRINPAIQFSVTRYVLAIGFFVAVVVFGLVSTLNLGVDLLPTAMTGLNLIGKILRWLPARSSSGHRATRLARPLCAKTGLLHCNNYEGRPCGVGGQWEISH